MVVSRFRPLFCSLVVIAFAAITTSSYAETWKQIGNLPSWTDLRCAYFWDTAHGVVGGDHCLYNYNSGIWTRGSYPEEIDTIKSLRLLDGYSLYAASGVSCIWKSSDHGVT